MPTHGFSKFRSATLGARTPKGRRSTGVTELLPFGTSRDSTCSADASAASGRARRAHRAGDRVVVAGAAQWLHLRRAAYRPGESCRSRSRELVAVLCDAV